VLRSYRHGDHLLLLQARPLLVVLLMLVLVPVLVLVLFAGRSYVPDSWNPSRSAAPLLFLETFSPIR